MSSGAQVRPFIEGYFDAWQTGPEEKILAYYSDDVTLQLPTGLLEGKAAVRDQFVHPFCDAFPDNLHKIQSLVYSEGLVAVEWVFVAVHSGQFNGVAPRGSNVKLSGCSFFVLRGGSIAAGRIYFNMPSLMEQIGNQL